MSGSHEIDAGKVDLDEVTALLASWADGESAGDPLFRAVYAELRRMAERAVNGERRDHTLQPTALVHEAYFRLLKQRQTSWQSRSHFFAIAAKMMRRILIDHARRRSRERRGGGQAPVPLEIAVAEGDDPTDLLDLDLALQRLAKFDSTKATIVELHFFAGLSVAETAEVLHCSTATVSRHWQTARAWIFRELRTSGHES